MQYNTNILITNGKLSKKISICCNFPNLDLDFYDVQCIDHIDYLYLIHVSPFNACPWPSVHVFIFQCSVGTSPSHV